MKSKLLAATLLAMIVSGTALAQTTETETTTTKKKAKKDESIIVHRKSDSKEKLTIVVDDEKVTINGKPIEEFKDDNIEVLRSKTRTFNATAPSIAKIRGFNTNQNFINGFALNGNKAVLGVCSEKADKGVKVTCITKEGAAEKAGILKEDIITKIGDATIATSDDLYKAVGKYSPDDKVAVTYLRDGKENTATVTLTKAKNTLWSGDNFRFNNDGYGQSYSYSYSSNKPRLGMQIQDVEEGDGVKVLDVDDETPAAKAGLKKDDVITEVDGASVKDVDELKTKLKDKKEGDSFKVKYKRDGKSQTAEIKYPKRLKTSSL